MKYPRDSFEYRINIDALHEMELCVPMTLRERNAIRSWVNKGYELESNAWNSVDEFGDPLNYLQAYRLEFGYSSGPWDNWRGPEDQFYWDEVKNTFRPQDDYD